MMQRIVGKDNKTLKLIKALKKKNNREEQGLFVVEGKKIAVEAFKFMPEAIHIVVVSENFFEKERDIVNEAEKLCDKVFLVKEWMFDEISETDTPQGILLVMHIPNKKFCADEKNCNILILDKVSEPGNLGTVIRTAEAFGYDGIYLMKGCADIFSSKTVRATMGSVFRMKFRTDCGIEEVAELKRQGFSIISTTPSGETNLEDLKTPERSAVVIGNEAHGVCEELMEISDFRVKITMEGLTESLNAAVAAGITMHWIKNCKGK